jgi:hypothetical protein
LFNIYNIFQSYYCYSIRLVLYSLVGDPMPLKQKPPSTDGKAKVIELRMVHTDTGFASAFRRRFQPRDEVEADLVEQMICLASRLRRSRVKVALRAAAEQEALLRGYRHTLVLFEQIRRLDISPAPKSPAAESTPARAA